MGQLTAPVVYGNDDRVEVYNHPSAALRDIARRSIVSLIRTTQLERGPDGRYVIFSIALRDAKNLCEDELFVDQPTAANCSGVLIDDDLVLTAGHCMRTQANCNTTSFVFNYYLEGPSELASIDDDDVYTCAGVLLRDESGPMAITPDFAIVQLDRPVTGGHRPAPLRPAAATLEQGESIAMIGFGSGLPAKIDSGGSVSDPRPTSLDYFVVNADAFAGHSGSAVFDSQDELAGILVAGRAPDYTTLPGEACDRVNTFDNDQGGEFIHYFAPIVAALCDENLGDENLCGDTACDGQPCGQKAPEVEPPPSNVTEVSASGCDVGAGNPGLGSIAWVVFALWVISRRSRRSAA
ncbi:MAG: serine protease [Polyangiales bacterium]